MNNVNPNTVTTWKITSSLRWLKKTPVSGPYPVMPILQQAWQCLETGEIEWKDVPTEAVPPPTVHPVPCKVCGEPMSHEGTRETLVGYTSPAGHDHDNNCQSRVYTCKNGHTMDVSKRRRCPVPGCGWVGKETCFCHSGPKVDKWPEEV